LNNVPLESTSLKTSGSFSLSTITSCLKDVPPSFVGMNEDGSDETRQSSDEDVLRMSGASPLSYIGRSVDGKDETRQTSIEDISPTSSVIKSSALCLLGDDGKGKGKSGTVPPITLAKKVEIVSPPAPVPSADANTQRGDHSKNTATDHIQIPESNQSEFSGKSHKDNTYYGTNADDNIVHIPCEETLIRGQNQDNVYLKKVAQNRVRNCKFLHHLGLMTDIQMYQGIEKANSFAHIGTYGGKFNIKTSSSTTYQTHNQENGIENKKGTITNQTQKDATNDLKSIMEPSRKSRRVHNQNNSCTEGFVTTASGGDCEENTRANLISNLDESKVPTFQQNTKVYQNNDEAFSEYNTSNDSCCTSNISCNISPNWDELSRNASDQNITTDNIGVLSGEKPIASFLSQTETNITTDCTLSGEHQNPQNQYQNNTETDSNHISPFLPDALLNLPNQQQNNMNLDTNRCLPDKYGIPSNCQRKLLEMLGSLEMKMDIDSIILSSDDVLKLLDSLEPESKVVIASCVNRKYSAFSHRLRVTSSDKLPLTKNGKATACVPLSSFPNICLGKLLVNNTYMCLHMFWLNPCTVGKVPFFTNINSIVITAALNYAKLSGNDLEYLSENNDTSNGGFLLLKRDDVQRDIKKISDGLPEFCILSDRKRQRWKTNPCCRMKYFFHLFQVALISLGYGRYNNYTLQDLLPIDHKNKYI